MFAEVCRRTAEMIVHWMRVGFVHGVMNTDNMSILGLTIDYGPYGWLDNYDPNWTPNTTDASEARYRFSNQPQIAHWNLSRLAMALHPLVEDTQALQTGLELYATTFETSWQAMMANKLGFDCWQADTDADIVSELLELFQSAETDMTLFFRELANIPASSMHPNQCSQGDDQTEDNEIPGSLQAAFYHAEELTPDQVHKTKTWIRRYQHRVATDGSRDVDRKVRMDAVNPKYVFRNYLAQLAIDKADQGDYSMIHELQEVLRTPYTEQIGKDAFAEKRPEWARHRPGCSMLSCSS
jgi:uncharacterized protein YdiU (UPF0061 family)